jgi:hypothetical protein
MTVLSVAASISFLALPLVMIWGWLRWFRRNEPRTALSTLSMVGLALASISELLAISMVVYAHLSGGFYFYDPGLMRIYGWGILLSLLGLAFAAVGVWRPSSLRWHAVACAIAILFYWFVQVTNE